MRIVSHKKLQDYYQEHNDAEVPLQRWYQIVEQADWTGINDIKNDFPSADYVGNQHYVFNIKGNSYRLIVVIKFMIGCVFIRWIGTHAEYDKIKDCSTL